MGHGGNIIIYLLDKEPEKAILQAGFSKIFSRIISEAIELGYKNLIFNAETPPNKKGIIGKMGLKPRASARL